MAISLIQSFPPWYNLVKIMDNMPKERSENNCLPHRELILSKKYIDSFWAKVEKNQGNECWKWKGYKNRQGYGRMGIAPSECVNAHRVEDLKVQNNEIHQSIWDEFEEVLRLVPKNELETLPSDAASEVDHYIYGTPKRKQ